MTKTIEINTEVRQLLLDPAFIVWVFDSDDDALENTIKTISCSAPHLFTSQQRDIDTARYILLHLEDFYDMFTKEDLDDVKERIKRCLKG